LIKAWVKSGGRLASELRGIAKILSLQDAARYVVAVLHELPEIVRTRTLVPADRHATGREMSFHVFGTEIQLSGDLLSSAREIYGRRVYFAMPQFRIQANDVVVDLGANAGVFTTLAARIARKVIAVEAQIGFCDEIRRNIKHNRSHADVAVEFGLVGSSSGCLADDQSVETASHFNGVRPPVLALCDILDRHKVEHVDFMKIDIEGSEFALFKEAHEWLPRTSKIAMEVHPLFGDPHELDGLLKRSGFCTTLLTDDLRPSHVISERGGYIYAWRPEP
jgi:FkbM family methyltransferase